MSILGIIGGMGVKATGRFYEMLTDLQTVTCEQDYLDIFMLSKPSTPDRTAFITGKSQKNPLDSLLESAKILEKAGVDCIALPCVTVHYFYEPLAQKMETPILNMLEETAGYTASQGYDRIGLLATDGTLNGQLFHKAFKSRNIEVVLPSSEEQTVLMDLIYAIKRGNDVDLRLHTIAKRLFEQGAQAVVLGCTELYLKKSHDRECIDALEILARAALKRLGTEPY